MPRTGERRPIVGVRLSSAGIARVDELAEQAEVNRSEIVRRLLALAVVDPKLVAKAVAKR